MLLLMASNTIICFSSLSVVGFKSEVNSIKSQCKCREREENKSIQNQNLLTVFHFVHVWGCRIESPHHSQHMGTVSVNSDIFLDCDLKLLLKLVWISASVNKNYIYSSFISRILWNWIYPYFTYFILFSIILSSSVSAFKFK